MTAKDKCKLLKEIRKKIAVENDISYITSECKHRGECLGTCPKCEDELRYLERELAKKKKLGKTVSVAGVALSLSLSLSGCSILLDQYRSNNENLSDISVYGKASYGGSIPIEGDITVPGEVSATSADTDTPQLMGVIDIPRIPDIKELLTMSKGSIGLALYSHTKKEINYYWGAYLTDSTDNTDTFIIDGTHSIIVIYDGSDSIIDFELNKAEEQT